MQERAYLAELVERVRSVLGPSLKGVYAGGSLALGGYESPRSDLDVAVVVDRPLEREEKDTLVRELRHEAFPCPARGLELVVYTEAAVRRPSADAAFELNLNTGRGMDFRADFEPVPGELHWFALDRGVLHEHGIALAGPPAADVFADPGPELLVPLLAETLRWCLANGARAEAVLAACRALRYAEDGVWASKASAARWAESRVDDGELVAQALRARAAGGGEVDPRRAAAFLEAALVRLDAAAPPRTGRPPPPR
jgi:hypothetical protein